jgi:hypothetical protein
MLIEDQTQNTVQKSANPSINVFSFEEGHKYYHEDDAQDNTVLPLKIKYASDLRQD